VQACTRQSTTTRSETMASNAVIQMIIITLIPWLELRGSIPYGIATGMSPLFVFIVCVGTNMALVPIIFFFLDHIFPFIRKYELVDDIVDGVQKRAKPYVDKYGLPGLAFFVAIPFPGSGAYSGALASYVLGIDRKHSVYAILLGILAAGAVMTLASMGVFSLIL